MNDKGPIVYRNAVLSLVILVLLVLGCDAWVTLNSKVIDEVGRPISGAKVTVSQGGTKVGEEFTAQDGSVRIFESITPGPFGGTRMITVVVTKEGFEPAEITFDWSQDGSNGGQKTRVITLRKVDPHATGY